MKNQFTLMNEQRFRPFFFTQFLGAFNDNVFKIALMTLVAFHASTLGLSDEVGKTLETTLPGLFILPFFLFSATAGQLADKFEKSQIMRFVKLFEIGIMLFASVGFFLHSIVMLAAAIFMMGTIQINRMTIRPATPTAFFKIREHPITVSTASDNIPPTTGIKFPTANLAVFVPTPSTTEAVKP